MQRNRLVDRFWEHGRCHVISEVACERVIIEPVPREWLGAQYAVYDDLVYLRETPADERGWTCCDGCATFRFSAAFALIAALGLHAKGSAPRFARMVRMDNGVGPVLFEIRPENPPALIIYS